MSNVQAPIFINQPGPSRNIFNHIPRHASSHPPYQTISPVTPCLARLTENYFVGRAGSPFSPRLSFRGRVSSRSSVTSWSLDKGIRYPVAMQWRRGDGEGDGKGGVASIRLFHSGLGEGREDTRGLIQPGHVPSPGPVPGKGLITASHGNRFLSECCLFTAELT